MLYRLAYVSSAVRPLSPDAGRELLLVSRRNNLRDEITGFLCYRNGMFFQLLEGRRSDVEKCFGRIYLDARHGAPPPS
ncbi:BLUF domain-containing protein [Wenxinia saemankumensis]|uniref:BLUF domain-containing protein n=1 Tax=Wenxinia saemankumensis TaxID=1447782 RepID=UPI000933ABB6|nr:BLUF domain-containing protein [Wenxinia saemankumensis]